MSASVDSIGGRIDGVDGEAPYVTALRASSLFADQTYQRDVDFARVKAMAAAFDPRLLGVLEVSDRDDETYALLDGQHRLQTVLVAHKDRGDAFVVCQVYSGLTVEDEARLFHQINKQRKPLTWWHEWHARRAAGDELVAAVDAVAAEFDLEVNPAPRDGSLRAVAALQRIMTELGGADTLRWTLMVAQSAWRRTADAYTGPMLFGLAMIFTNYDTTDDGELDTDRLVRALSEIPPQQIRARAVILREAVRAELPRLHAQVITGLYNDQRGRKVQTFLDRAPKGTKVALRHHPTRPSSVAPPPQAPPAAAPAAPVARPRPGPPAPVPLGESTRLDRMIASPPVLAGICTCGHGAHRHPGGEICTLRGQLRLPGIRGRVMNWRRRAACRDLGTDMFFPVGTTGKTLERDIGRAVKVCAGCPVRPDCAGERPATGGGVWGGRFYLDSGKPWTPPTDVVMGGPQAGPVAELVAAGSQAAP